MDFLNQSFRLFTFSRIDVRVHILYLLWMGFRLYDSARSNDMQFALWWLGLLFVIILCHEFGHCFGARSVGGDAEQILMWPLGGLAFAHAPQTAWAQFVTVACGPLVNVLFCLASALVLVFSTGTIHVMRPDIWWPINTFMLTAQWQFYVAIFFWINLYLLCFNLLPIYPLDGGQLMRTLLWPFMGMHRSLIVSAQIGIAGAVLFGFWGVTKADFMLVGIALFGGMSSFQALQAARYGLQQEYFTSYEAAGRYRRTDGWFSRLMKRLRGGVRPARPADNPNPGGWDAKMEREERFEVEIDRILQKVHEHGLRSLSYVERQKLERATRDRQRREREVDRGV